MKSRVFLVAALLSSGCAWSEAPHAVFENRDKTVRVVVTTQKRVPDLLGGEEYVRARVTADGRQYGPWEIDINGRFGDTLHADISTDGRWVRFYQRLPRPVRGARTKRLVNGEMVDFLVGAKEAGSQARDHPYSILAYVSTEPSRMYRFAHQYSTAQMRDAYYFGLQESLPATQRFEGRDVTWEPATRVLARQATGRNP